MAQSLAGSGVSVSNVAYTGDNRAGGMFTGGTSSIGFDSGIVLDTGKVQTYSTDSACSQGVEGPNTCYEAIGSNPAGPSGTDNSTDFGLPGDSNLDTLTGSSTQDAAVLQFDFVPQQSTVQFSYVFSSEEYSDYANTGFNDVFGFFVNNQNCALVPSTSQPVSVNTINNGNDQSGGDTTAHNPQYFRDNVQPSPSIDSQMDGLTTVLTCTASVTAGQTNHMKLAIADTSDGALDSAVFLQAGSLISGTAVNTSLSGGGQSGATITVPLSTAVTDSATLSGANAATATGTVNYKVYSDAACTTQFADAGTKTITGGTVPDSDPITFSTAGTYYWQASYSGDTNNNASTSLCGSETVTAVGPPTATITTPPNNATYTQGQVVNASYSCAEAPGGPGLLTTGGCVGTVPNGSPIDTSTTGPHTFTVTANSQDGQSGMATSNYTVTPASNPATALKFATQPTNAKVGQVISGTAYSPTGPPVTVDVVDSMGNIVTGSSAPVTLSLKSNPTGATLGGTTTVNAVNGVATFNNLTVNKAGLGDTLTATSPGLTSATSSPFDVNNVVVTCSENVNCAGAVSNTSINVSVTAGFNPNASDAGTLAVSLNAGPELACAGYQAQGVGWIYFNASATTRTKTIVYSIMNPKGHPLSAFQLCYGAPYQFKTRSGAPATRTVWSTGTVEYVGLLPNCPTQGTITGPCIKSRVAHTHPASVALTAFVPAGLPGDPRVHG